MMTKTLVWTRIAMEEGRAPKPPEFYVNAGDRVELYVAPHSGEPEPPAWDGEGLPPAGCECEVRGTPSGSMCPAVIDYIDGKHCIWHWKNGSGETMHARVSAMEFRPIRSEEDRAVDEMVAAMEHAIESSGGGYVVAVSSQLEMGARALYRAGYRKTGGE